MITSSIYALLTGFLIIPGLVLGIIGGVLFKYFLPLLFLFLALLAMAFIRALVNSLIKKPTDDFSYQHFEVVKNYRPSISRVKERIGNKYYRDQNGYFRFINSDILVHRWMAEKKLGRKLWYGEVVHHIDGNKGNNRPENLYICSDQEEHDRIHQKNMMIYGSWHKPISKEYSSWSL